MTNVGMKWTLSEEKILLQELNENKNIKDIASFHKRNNGGIRSRIKHIAYQMYANGIPMEEIENKTKLNKTQIEYLIKKKACDKNISMNLISLEEIYDKLLIIDKNIAKINKLLN